MKVKYDQVEWEAYMNAVKYRLGRYTAKQKCKHGRPMVSCPLCQQMCKGGSEYGHTQDCDRCPAGHNGDNYCRTPERFDRPNLLRKLHELEGGP